MSTDRKGGGNRKKKLDSEISMTAPPETVPESLPEQTTAQESIPAMVNDKNLGMPEEENPGPKAKARKFPAKPGVYLMKDAQGRVVYVGKAKNLRARAGSYFQKTSETDHQIRDWIGEVVDIDFLEADSEVD